MGAAGSAKMTMPARYTPAAWLPMMAAGSGVYSSPASASRLWSAHTSPIERLTALEFRKRAARVLYASTMKMISLVADARSPSPHVSSPR